MFGWNLQGTDLNVDSDVWLPRLSIDDAMNVALRVNGLYGVFLPQ